MNAPRTLGAPLQKCVVAACKNKIRTGWTCRICGRGPLCAYCCKDKHRSFATCGKCAAAPPIAPHR